MERRRTLEWVLLGSSLGICLLACLWYRFPLLDDSYICFRYARNLWRGLGLVYNPGEYVEGYTTLSWVLLLAGSFPLGLDVEIYSSALGIVFTLACVGVVWWFAGRWGGATSIHSVAVILVATNAYLAFWSGKGMETSLFVFLVTGGALHAADRFDGKGKGWGWGIWFALAAVTRPEGILYGGFAACCLLLRSLIRKENWKPELFGSLIAVTPFLLQLLWRVWYYGDILPNTFYAKMDANTAFYLRGFEYLLKGLQAHPIATTGLVAATLLGYRLPPRVRFLAAFGWVGLASSVLMGGDHFHGFRMIVVFVPTLYVLAQESVILILGELRKTPIENATKVSIVLLFFLLFRGGFCFNHRLLNDYNEGLEKDMRDRREYGEWIAENSEPGDWIATAASGLLPYVADRPSIDCLGLTDRHIARVEVALGEGYPGHEKGDGAYLLSRAPRFLLPDHRLAPKAYYSGDFQYLFSRRPGLDFLQLPELDQWYELRVEKRPGGFLHVYERREKKVETPRKRMSIDPQRLPPPVGWNR